MSLYLDPESLRKRNKERSKESEASSRNSSALELQKLSEPPKKAPAKKANPEPDPHDTLEIVYNWRTSTFSYKRLSKLNMHAVGVPIPRFSKKIRLTPWGAKFEESRMVELPSKVFFGRNFLRKFENVWVEEGERPKKA